MIALFMACLAVSPAMAGEGQDSEPAADKQAVSEKTQTPAQGQSMDLGEVTVTGRIMDEATANVPAVVESITAEGIERINAVETSDVFKYMPGSYLRKLYPGGTNSPLIIRGNSSSMTGRTLVVADGIRLSDFTAAGHSNAPKWFMVAPQEIEKVDVIYGPFSAALSGNSMSGTALITTHMPEKLEVDTSLKYFHQNAHAYKTDDDLGGFNAFGSVGSKTGKLSYTLWINHLETENQSISYKTKTAAAGGTPSGTQVTGWVADRDPAGESQYVLGAAGISDIENNSAKIKLAYDLTDASKLRFTSALWDSDRNEDSPETYLRDAGGNPVYSGEVTIDGRGYSLNDSTFRYRIYEGQDWLNGLSYDLDAGDGFKLNATVSAYTQLENLTRQSTDAPPAAKAGGAGRVTDSENGWYTGDLKASRDLEWQGFHTVAAGYHFDQYHTDSKTWNATDWYNDIRTTLREGSEGKTRTQALFLEDTWHIQDQWAVYLGARYEWWEGFDAGKSIDGASGRVTTGIDDKTDDAFSPKFSTTFTPNEDWQLRFSMALATRFPTVGELYYGGISPTGVINKNNPGLKPEESFAKDFTITRFLGDAGEARLTFFEDDIDNAIFRQTNVYTNVRNFQNVDEVRTRGIELAYNIRRLFFDGLGLFTNLAWTDSEILRNDNVPASVGKTFPRVPEWRVKSVLDYSPSENWSFTFAGHYAGTQYGELDNSDTNGGYGGVDDFLVFDAKATFRFLSGFEASLGVDNITDELYFVSHPYPMRTYFAELKYSF
jgi:iron complex outermembrane receptor protein